MKKIISISMLFVLFAGAAWLGEAVAKGGEDKPTIVQIDQDGNDVDANVTNEVEIKNDTGSELKVKVENDLTEPVPISTGAAARIPFVATESDFDGGTAVNVSFATPPGEILVIEYVSAGLEATTDSNGVGNATLLFLSGGNLVRVDLNVHEQPGLSNSRLSYSVSEPVRLYVDPGTVISFNANHGPGTADLSGFATISGYLIPATEPSLSP